MPDSQTATIGPKTFIKGKINGDDDLVIQGRFEGTVNLPKNRVQIAEGSDVKADVKARSIEVDGHVRGKLTGISDVVVRASGRIEGDLAAPRIKVDAGAQIDGSVDMQGAETSKKPALGSRIDKQAEKQAQRST